jgi:hypothetical protein
MISQVGTCVLGVLRIRSCIVRRISPRENATNARGRGPATF